MLPELEHLSALEKGTHPARVSPSHSPKANRLTSPRTGTRREASVGRAGGGRRLHPNAVVRAIVNTASARAFPRIKPFNRRLLRSALYWSRVDTTAAGSDILSPDRREGGGEQPWDRTAHHRNGMSRLGIWSWRKSPLSVSPSCLMYHDSIFYWPKWDQNNIDEKADQGNRDQFFSFKPT
jgi:hypothetical protein